MEGSDFLPACWPALAWLFREDSLSPNHGELADNQNEREELWKIVNFHLNSETGPTLSSFSTKLCRATARSSSCSTLKEAYWVSNGNEDKDVRESERGGR